MIYVLALTTFLIALTHHYYKKPRIRNRGQLLRRPPGTLPILGNAIVFLRPRHILFEWFVECFQKFGTETVEISVPTLPPGVVINSPENLEFVLKNEGAISKGKFFQERTWDLFGSGIINATGDHWRAQRKAGLKFFSGTNLDALVEDVLPEVYSNTRKDLMTLAQKSLVMDLQKVFLDLTTTVMGQMAYDMDIDASSPFSRAFDHASDQVGLRFQNPLYLITEFFSGSKFSTSLIEVKRFGRQIVANAQKRRSKAAFESLITNDEIIFGSLIDSLMETFDDSVVVADSALNFLTAGRDTTAQSFTWVFYALMRHPEVIPRLRKEADSICKLEPGVDGSLDLTVADLQPTKIPYTMAVFYETLRLYPPIPFEIKQCEIDIVLPDNTFLPKGSIIVWCIWAMTRSKEIFGEDSAVFRPSRWLDDDGKLINKTSFEFPVFNGGPRSCLGKKMAELMATYLIVHLVREFDFEEIRDPNNQQKERVSQNSLTLPMEGGLPCRVKLRQK